MSTRVERDKAKRDANAAAGLCRCGAYRDGIWKLCSRCRSVVRAKTQRRQEDLAPEQLEARAEALESCVVHLGLDWTDEKLEIEQGNVVAKRLQDEANKLRLRAAERRATLRRPPYSAPPR